MKGLEGRSSKYLSISIPRNNSRRLIVFHFSENMLLHAFVTTSQRGRGMAANNSLQLFFH